MIEESDLPEALTEIAEEENIKFLERRKYFIAINNLSEYISPYDIPKLGYTVKIFGINGTSLNLDNFREEASKRYYEKLAADKNFLIDQEKSLLWLYSILFMEDFALFIQQIAIAKKLHQEEFHSVRRIRNGIKNNFDENFWINPKQLSYQKSGIKSKIIEILNSGKNLVNSAKRIVRRKYDFWMNTTLTELFRRLRAIRFRIITDLSKRILRKIVFQLKGILRKRISYILFLLSKISIYVASKSDFVLIVDAGNVKRDKLQIKRTPYIDYYPDLESIYRMQGKVKILNLRPQLNLFQIIKQLRSGFWPVWPLSNLPKSFEAESTVRSFGYLCQNLYHIFQYPMSPNLKNDIFQYAHEIDFVIANFQPLEKSRLVLLSWDGRNRAIAIGLNELGMSFDTYQSALGSYDLSHGGINQIGTRSNSNKNGVPTPRKYFIWRNLDLSIMQRLGFHTTKFVVSGSLRLSAKRNAGHIDQMKFYKRHFGKHYERIFVWAPVLTALGTSIIFKKRHEEIFQDFLSKLKSTDCILIKPWPGSKVSDFEPIANKYQNVAIWNPEQDWTNDGLLKITYGVIGTFSSFLLEANLAECRILILNFPETRNYFNFETYRDFLSIFQSVATKSEFLSFDLEHWERIKLGTMDSAVFKESRVLEIRG